MNRHARIAEASEYACAYWPSEAAYGSEGQKFAAAAGLEINAREFHAALDDFAAEWFDPARADEDGGWDAPTPAAFGKWCAANFDPTEGPAELDSLVRQQIAASPAHPIDLAGAFAQVFGRAA